MSIRVVTITTCDRCGDSDERDGAHGSTPPDGWALVTIQWMGPAGCTGGRRWSKVCCERCTDAVATTLECGAADR